MRCDIPIVGSDAPVRPTAHGPLPEGIGPEPRPMGTVTGQDVNADRALSVDISFPATMEDGQYCVAYGIAWGGTPPYSFGWGGVDETWDGPLGSDQIAGGYFSGNGALRVTVEDSGSPSKSGNAEISYSATDEYNPDCEG